MPEAAKQQRERLLVKVSGELVALKREDKYNRIEKKTAAGRKRYIIYKGSNRIHDKKT